MGIAVSQKMELAYIHFFLKTESRLGSSMPPPERGTSSILGDTLVEIPKPKTLRPYRREEVGRGWWFRAKAALVDYSLEGISEVMLKIGGTWHTFVEVLTNFHRIHDDGSLGPAGVEE